MVIPALPAFAVDDTASVMSEGGMFSFYFCWISFFSRKYLQAFLEPLFRLLSQATLKNRSLPLQSLDKSL